MKARVLQEQSDLFEVGVLSQTAEVSGVSIDDVMASPSGPPIVIVGRLMAAARLPDLRRFALAATRAQTTSSLCRRSTTSTWALLRNARGGQSPAAGLVRVDSHRRSVRDSGAWRSGQGPLGSLSGDCVGSWCHRH